MKNLILLVSILLCFASCSNDEFELKVSNLTIEKLEGTWKLTETYISPGGETTWRTVEDGMEYVFKNNNTFQASEGECREGNYELDLENDLLIFNCEDSSNSARSYKLIKLTSSELEINYIGCIEACILRFRKQ
ncbi:hypothetical protein GCM10023115_40430 [Pontixanthobacter gangjinensis]|uniref:Lipocalin-like domain-containing protein n=1 Tax=Christiangramia aestuarii TaxID=1028746 RepID=A0A7K1LRZ2_9FLAO|nr:lipocalin family protein [Christiangramia aestuarii]MUP43572.1 hypothetical protein [Christiangramia aestuarii]